MAQFCSIGIRLSEAETQQSSKFFIVWHLAKLGSNLFIRPPGYPDILADGKKICPQQNKSSAPYDGL